MLEKIKNKIHDAKNKIAVSGIVGTAVVALGSTTALAASNDTTANLTTGMEGFIGLVTTMINVVLGSPTLSIAFAASFAFLAVRLIRRLKKT